MTQQTTPLRYSPTRGATFLNGRRPFGSSAADYRDKYPDNTWTFNPWTGEARSGEDIVNDPQGHAIVPPGEEVMAAGELPAEPSTQPIAFAVDREPFSRDDVEFLRAFASGISAAKSAADSVAKHRLKAIAERLEALTTGLSKSAEASIERLMDASAPDVDMQPAIDAMASRGFSAGLASKIADAIYAPRVKSNREPFSTGVAKPIKNWRNDLDEDDDRWSLNAVMDDLLDGLGASEDHATATAALRSAGFADDIIDRMARKICAQPASAPSSVKDSNPKDAIADSKLPLHLISPIVACYQAIAHWLGNIKYGAWNFRAAGARASVYYAAARRHLDAWWEGQENDPTDGTPHLANALACIAIIIDAKHSGKLTDDRPPSRADELVKVRAEFEALMPKLREQYADRNPKHYSIGDGV